MKIGSLFSGIGGLELGIERATGARTRWQVEIDPFCRRVLERHWPDAKRFDDVRTVGAHNLEPIDILCGGFPCQDLSVAGRGAGLDGERSGLFFEVTRIVREIRPRYVLLENVAALLTRGLGRVLGELAACGYDARWGCFSAASVGAPHLRERIFILAADAERGAQRDEEMAHRPRRRRRPVSDKPRLRALGNAVVPQVAEQAWRALITQGTGQ